ncbi:unnamed protein product [Cyclocybe aegerita]|uniref:Uncharacterized protein n=1 Tax=Cyclocybe aegerita TaxID=1973307 RepID=A0A8S0WPT5_CYCAE|nr:unnamed protein product [Cyclocybe aegerita]
MSHWSDVVSSEAQGSRMLILQYDHGHSALLDFLAHCVFARLSNELTQAIEHASLFFINFLCQFNQDAWAMNVADDARVVHHCHQLLSCLSVVLTRKDFPRDSDGCVKLIEKMQETWLERPLAGTDNFMRRLLTPTMTHKRKLLRTFLRSIGINLLSSNSRNGAEPPTYLGVHVAEEFIELIRGKFGASQGVTLTLIASHLMFWMKCVQQVAEKYPSSNFSGIALAWADKASEALASEATRSTLSMGVLLLFIASLLPYAPRIHMTLASSAFLAKQEDTLRKLGAFPKTVKYYKDQVNVYIKRCT